jgi:ribulose kinase
MYRKIGIDDAIERGMCGHDVLPLGAGAGGVTKGAASHLGIPAGCKVSVITLPPSLQLRTSESLPDAKYR